MLGLSPEHDVEDLEQSVESSDRPLDAASQLAPARASAPTADCSGVLSDAEEPVCWQCPCGWQSSLRKKEDAISQHRGCGLQLYPTQKKSYYFCVDRDCKWSGSVRNRHRGCCRGMLKSFQFTDTARFVWCREHCSSTDASEGIADLPAALASSSDIEEVRACQACGSTTGKRKCDDKSIDGACVLQSFKVRRVRPHFRHTDSGPAGGTSNSAEPAATAAAPEAAALAATSEPAATAAVATESTLAEDASQIFCVRGCSGLIEHVRSGCSHVPMLTVFPGDREVQMELARKNNDHVVTKLDANGKPTHIMVRICRIDDSGAAWVLPFSSDPVSAFKLMPDESVRCVDGDQCDKWVRHSLDDWVEIDLMRRDLKDPDCLKRRSRDPDTKEARKRICKQLAKTICKNVVANVVAQLPVNSVTERDMCNFIASEFHDVMPSETDAVDLEMLCPDYGSLLHKFEKAAGIAEGSMRKRPFHRTEAGKIVKLDWAQRFEELCNKFFKECSELCPNPGLARDDSVSTSATAAATTAAAPTAARDDSVSTSATAALTTDAAPAAAVTPSPAARVPWTWDELRNEFSKPAEVTTNRLVLFTGPEGNPQHNGHGLMTAAKKAINNGLLQLQRLVGAAEKMRLPSAAVQEAIIKARDILNPCSPKPENQKISEAQNAAKALRNAVGPRGKAELDAATKDLQDLIQGKVLPENWMILMFPNEAKELVMNFKVVTALTLDGIEPQRDVLPFEVRFKNYWLTSTLGYIALQRAMAGASLSFLRKLKEPPGVESDKRPGSDEPDWGFFRELQEMGVEQVPWGLYLLKVHKSNELNSLSWKAYCAWLKWQRDPTDADLKKKMHDANDAYEEAVRHS